MNNVHKNAYDSDVNKNLFYSFPKDFIWGIASAPAHVEDQLQDSWIDWSHENGKVAAFKNQIQPEKRLLFWSEPEIEINYVHDLNVSCFRMGIDWGRFYQTQIQNSSSWKWLSEHPDFLHYKKIISKVKQKNIKIMMTLFHHSHPKEHLTKGGWSHHSSVNLFSEWAIEIYKLLQNDVDFWITFNEPNIYNILTYSAGIWPQYGYSQGVFALLNLGFFKGNFIKAQLHMIEAHKIIYTQIKKINPYAQIGIAQHLAYFMNVESKRNLFIKTLENKFNYSFLDSIQNHMDFAGVNFYGAEYIQGFRSRLLTSIEYSEAGRAVHPRGLVEIISQCYKRYHKPIFITENGTSDDTDVLRRSYLLEHLVAVHKTLTQEIPVMGYLFWTLSDNWEWADGYGPKFGLLKVNRNNLQQRDPRASYELYKNIIHENGFSLKTRQTHWNNYLKQKNTPRPFYRHSDGVTGLDEPAIRPFIGNLWNIQDH